MSWVMDPPVGPGFNVDYADEAVIESCPIS